MKQIDKINLSIKFQPKDAWIGVYFDTTKAILSKQIHILDIYICLIPFVPIHIKIRFKLHLGEIDSD